MKIKLVKLYLLLPLLCMLIGACTANQAQANNHLSAYDWFHSETRHNIWGMLSERLQFTSTFSQPQVQKEIHWFKHNRDYIRELTTNAKPYVYYVFQQTLKRKMPPEIALIPMIESNYNPFIYSRQGATGLWQLMPGTASGMKVKIDWWYDGRRDIIASTKTALDYLNYLHKFFNNNWLLAIAAYNAGEGTVLNAIHRNKKLHKPTDYWHLALPAETKYYVPKLLALAAIINKNPLHSKYIKPVKYQPYFTSISLKGQYDLALLAKIANMNIQQFRLLNPGFRRFTSSPNSTYQLLIPINNAKPFQQQLADIKSHRVTWRHHIVKPGDTLISLAKHYHTNVNIIKQINHLRSNQLHLKTSLLIPETRHKKNIIEQTHDTTIAEDDLPGPKYIMHTVKPRDSVWSLAKTYKIKPSDIRFWNHMGSNHLTVGNKILIWKPHVTESRSYFTHTVKKHDSIIRLAKRFNTHSNLIRLYNGMRNNRLYIGQKLKIPYPRKKHYHHSFKNQMVVHYVKPGDSIISLAKYYKIPKNKLIKWNHLKKNQYLKLGQVIKIYFTE